MGLRLGLLPLGGALAAVAAAVAVGAAASLAATSGSLGAGSVAMPRCTTAGLGVIQDLSGSNVISVTVSGLPVACGIGTLQVAVNNGAASSTGSTTVPTGGGSVTVTLAAAVAVSTAETTDVIVVGP
jgi:hypothetical protein